MTGYLYDYKKLLHETDDLGGEITSTYASSTSDEYGDLIGEDGEYVHQYDAQANTNALLDDTGQVQAQYKYTAFGEVAAVSVEGSAWSSLDTWSSLTANQWAGLSADAWANLPADLSTHMLAGGKKQYYLDPETELYLLGMGTNGRYYDPATTRFLSEDPIRQSSGDPNLYPYVNNNPVNHLDPSGHDAASDAAEKARQEALAKAAAQKSQAQQQQKQQQAAASSQDSKQQNQGQPAAPGKAPAAGTAAAPQPTSVNAAAASNTTVLPTGQSASTIPSTLPKIELPPGFEILGQKSIFERDRKPPKTPQAGSQPGSADKMSPADQKLASLRGAIAQKEALKDRRINNCRHYCG